MQGRHDIFSEKDMRKTKQRNAIYEYLLRAEKPLSAEEIFLHINQEGVSASLSTVYRNLEAMTGKNIVSKTMLSEDERAKFTLFCEQHRHHLICVRCSKMISIDNCPLGEFETVLNENTDFEVTGHKLEIYGYCPDCRDKKGK